MKDPAFLFYPESFLVGTMDMTDEEAGRYIRLLCVQHQKGHLPEDKIKKAPSAVQEKFIKDTSGLYYNQRLEDEMEKRKKWTESRKENGKKGGRPKKETEEKNHMVSEKNHMVPVENHMRNRNRNRDRDFNINKLIDNDNTKLQEIRSRIRAVNGMYKKEIV